VRKPKNRAQAMMAVIEAWCRAYAPQVTVEDRLRLYCELIALWAELSIEAESDLPIYEQAQRDAWINRSRRP
jgi:hypothetical protein